MKNELAAAWRRDWNDQHSLLREHLEADRDFAGTIQLFLAHHAVTHSALLGVDAPFSFQDEVLKGLTGEQMRGVTARQVNSVVWMLWHITRIEDATVNVLLAGVPQVFHVEDWQRKIGSPFVDVGNEMTAADIGALSASVNIEALLAYRLEVGRRTRQVAGLLEPVDLKKAPTPARLQQLLQDGTVRAEAHWLLEYWGGHPAWNLLLMPASRHSTVHFNEIERMLPGLRRLQPA